MDEEPAAMQTGPDGQSAPCIAPGILYRLGPAPAVAAPLQAADAASNAAEASDETLMMAYRDGDASAFERLYSRHRGGLYRYLLHQCRKAAVAEELFQDVWLNLIRARARYVPEARFATYLYRIAHNRLVDHFRRASHRPLTQSEAEADDTMAEPAADARSQPEVRLESKAAIACFMVALEALPDAQREAFVMHEEAGMSVEEIARATGVNTETAKSRLRYAVAKLRRGLEEWM